MLQELLLMMAGALEHGRPAPEFTLRGSDGEQVRLADFRGKKLVLAFYPGDWTSGCESELARLQENLELIRGYGAEVAGVSTDGVPSHRAWAERLRLGFPLLSDFWPHGEVARRYGVFLEDLGVSSRALFFIDEKGVLQGAWIAENPGVTPDIGIVFDSLQGLGKRESPEEVREEVVQELGQQGESESEEP